MAGKLAHRPTFNADAARRVAETIIESDLVDAKLLVQARSTGELTPAPDHEHVRLDAFLAGIDPTDAQAVRGMLARLPIQPPLRHLDGAALEALVSRPDDWGPVPAISLASDGDFQLLEPRSRRERTASAFRVSRPTPMVVAWLRRARGCVEHSPRRGRSP